VPKGAGGNGHNALLVGNNDTGWEFISKEGRNEGETATLENNPLKGGPALEPRYKFFKTIDAFLSDKKFKKYTEGIVFEVVVQQNDVSKMMLMEAKSKYAILFNNCGQAVDKTVSNFGIETFDRDVYKYGGSIGTPVFYSIIPNLMYKTIKKVNTYLPRSLIFRRNDK
jgi:hypothetical protein